MRAAYSSGVAKSSNAEIIFRVNVVYEMLCASKSRHTICHELSKKWNVGERQIDHYIAKARVKLAEDAEITRQAYLAETRGAIRALIDKCDKKGNHQTMLGALRLAAELTQILK